MTAATVNGAELIQVEEKANGVRRFTSPYFTIETPLSLLYHYNHISSNLHFEVSPRQSQVSFSIQVLRLEAVNGYKTGWNDLSTYFEFIKQPFLKEKIGSYEWAYNGTENNAVIQKTLFKIHNDYWVQISYFYPKQYQPEYGPMIESMVESVALQ